MIRVLGPLLFDIISWMLFAAIVSPSLLGCGLVLWAGWTAGLPVWSLPAFIPPLVPAFLVGISLTTWVVRLFIPRPREGKHRFPDSADALRWALHFALRRTLLGPPWERWLLGTHSLRWLALHALGAETSWTAMMSSDVAVLDGWGLVVGPDSMIGAECSVTAHMILGPTLVVAPTSVGARSQILGGVKLGFGVRVEDEVIVGPLTRVRPHARIGSGARLGMQVDVGSGAQIGAGARIGDRAVIGAGAVVPDGAVVPADARIEREEPKPPGRPEAPSSASDGAQV